MHGGYYLLLPSFGQQMMHLPLDLHVSGSTADISCILNGQQLRFEHLEFGPVLELRHGRHELFCSNMDGASDAVHVQVAAPEGLPRLYQGGE